ncbi:NACHT domain-containing protein [Streptomyces sp. NPDC051815]|uniref:NACHT domain-containing protein n=1 Tax=Streptomyces sp. NPDC051815 TaxID=3365674 RepID=UPI00378AD46C
MKDKSQLWVSNSQIAGHNIQIGFAGGDVNVVIENSPGDSQTYSRAHIADQLVRECAKRREILRRLPGLTDEQVLASQQHDPGYPQQLSAINPGEVVAIAGPMGSGKSDLANLWLSDEAKKFAEDESTPVPLWIAARSVSPDLGSWVEQRVTPSVLASVGVSVVLDGIDETSKSLQLIEDSEMLATRWPKSRIVITGRPDVFPDHLTRVHVEPWEEDPTFEMLRAVTGSRHLYPGSFPPQVRDAVRRPLFAMLVASSYGQDGGIPKSSAGLIRHCALASLERGSDTWSEYFPLLRRIAIASVRSDGDVALASVGGEAIRRDLRSLRLVSIIGHKVSFTLSLFEQWFAAEALLQEEVSLEEIISDIGTFSKWRYVLALAVQTGGKEQVDKILCTLAEWNPGAASWVIKEGLERPFLRTESSELPGWKELANRLHQAMTSWRSGLGGLTVTATPGDSGYEPSQLKLNLAVDESQERFIWAWQNREIGMPPIAYLSDPKALRKEGIAIGTSRAPAGDHWIWPWLLDRMKDSLEKRLPTALHLEAPTGGVIEEEHTWAIIYALMQRSSRLRAESVDTSELRRIIGALRENAHSSGHPTDSYYFTRPGRRVITRLDLILVEEWLDRQEGSELIPPGPSADVPNPRSGWVWGFYTPERLLELTEFVYARALKAYSEITLTLLNNFGYTLSHASILPGTLKGRLRTYEGDSFSDGPSLEYYLLPDFNTEAKESRVSFSLENSDEWRLPEQHGRHSAYMKRYYVDNPDRAPFSNYGWTHTALNVWDARPATNIAFRWAWSDLASLGWLSHSAPDLK